MTTDKIIKEFRSELDRLDIPETKTGGTVVCLGELLRTDQVDVIEAFLTKALKQAEEAKTKEIVKELKKWKIDGKYLEVGKGLHKESLIVGAEFGLHMATQIIGGITDKKLSNLKEK